MDQILKVGTFVRVSFGDAVSFCETVEEIVDHVEQVMGQTVKNFLKIKIEKCIFTRKELLLLGHQRGGCQEGS